MLRSVTLADVRSMVEADPRAHVPVHLLETARFVWPAREIEFLRTNCQSTCARLRHLILPDEAKWVEVFEPPAVSIYMVQFGDDHEFMVANGRIFQSYAFEHEVEESAYDARKPYYMHVSRYSDAYRCYRPTFFVPSAIN